MITSGIMAVCMITQLARLMRNNWAACMIHSPNHLGMRLIQSGNESRYDLGMRLVRSGNESRHDLGMRLVRSGNESRYDLGMRLVRSGNESRYDLGMRLVRSGNEFRYLGLRLMMLWKLSGNESTTLANSR